MTDRRVEDRRSDAVNHPAHYGGADNPYEAIKVKSCSRCEQPKPLDQFSPDNRRKDGRGAKCRSCADEVRRAYYEKYPEKEAQRRLSNAQHGMAWHQRNRDSQIDRMRWGRLRKVYGLSRVDYESMLHSQGGVCAICGAGKPGRGDRFFAVDHCHTTGKIRGLLCQRCNSGLGYFGEKEEVLERAIDYLRRNSPDLLHRTQT